MYTHTHTPTRELVTVRERVRRNASPLYAQSRACLHCESAYTRISKKQTRKESLPNDCYMPASTVSRVPAFHSPPPPLHSAPLLPSCLELHSNPQGYHSLHTRFYYYILFYSLLAARSAVLLCVPASNKHSIILFLEGRQKCTREQSSVRVSKYSPLMRSINPLPSFLPRSSSSLLLSFPTHSHSLPFLTSSPVFYRHIHNLPYFPFSIT